MYCYVGDLLGFKNIMLNLDPDEQSKRFDEWINLVNLGIEKFDLPKHQLVSDTIFAGADFNKYGLEKLVSFGKYMMEEGIAKSLPLRGAYFYWRNNLE